MLHTNTVTVTTYNTLYEVMAHFPTLPLDWSLCGSECVTDVISSFPLVPDSDRAGVHAGRSQTSS